MFKKEIWEIIPGLKINWKPAPYWVVNEKSIRKNALINFILWLSVFTYTIITKDFFYFNILVPFLFFDFFMKISFWPKYSLLSLLSDFLVKNLKKEYVWSKQKRFAWSIWFIISSIALILVVWFWITSLLPMFLCLLCITFMFAEAFFWYCVWCTIYAFLRDKWIIKKEKYAPVCANWACEIKIKNKLS